jgi:hypothetical protein
MDDCKLHHTQNKVFSSHLAAFSQVLEGETSATRRLNIDPDQVKNGLAQLALTVIKLLHELLERQAIRRMEAGNLTDEEIEQLGTTLMQQAQEIEKLREVFGLQPEDLNIDLGPLGKLL